MQVFQQCHRGLDSFRSTEKHPENRQNNLLVLFDGRLVDEEEGGLQDGR